MKFFARPRPVELVATHPISLEGKGLSESIQLLTLIDPTAVSHWVASRGLKGWEFLRHPLLFFFGGVQLGRLLRQLGLNKEEISEAQNLILDYFEEGPKKVSLVETLNTKLAEILEEVSRLKTERNELQEIRKGQVEDLLHTRIVLVEEIIAKTDRIKQIEEVLARRQQLLSGFNSLERLLTTAPASVLAEPDSIEVQQEIARSS